MSGSSGIEERFAGIITDGWNGGAVCSVHIGIDVSGRPFWWLVLQCLAPLHTLSPKVF